MTLKVNTRLTEPRKVNIQAITAYIANHFEIISDRDLFLEKATIIDEKSDNPYMKISVNKREINGDPQGQLLFFGRRIVNEYKHIAIKGDGWQTFACVYIDSIEEMENLRDNLNLVIDDWKKLRGGSAK